MRITIFLVTLFLASFSACRQKGNEAFIPLEDPASFLEIGQIDLGGTGASEISAYDPISKRLFVVNGESTRIDIVNLASPSAPVANGNINIVSLGAANSVAVKKGILAVGIEAPIKQNVGKVAFYDTKTLALLQTVTVGALPDMVTFSPDGAYLLSANEGEPDATYANDPVGSVSIINLSDYSVTTLDFTSFAGQEAILQTGGFRIFGLNASFEKDIEPEYITISDDSKTAWVTLQENNGVAKIDLATKTITNIYPLGFKNYNNEKDAIDPSDRDGGIIFRPTTVKGMYQPDAIAQYTVGGTTYWITANEGDARDYTAFKEETTVNSVMLDPLAFSDATLKTDVKLGRLTITNTLGKLPNNTYNELFSFGARSFSIWNAQTGALVYDSGNDLEKKVFERLGAGTTGGYDDTRSDNKGVEPEGVVIGYVAGKPIAFIGLERADAIVSYDISNPQAPKFLQVLRTGDAPEGLLFIPASESPTGRNILIASCENDGVVRIYQTAGYLPK